MAIKKINFYINPLEDIIGGGVSHSLIKKETKEYVNLDNFYRLNESFEVDLNGVNSDTEILSDVFSEISLGETYASFVSRYAMSKNAEGAKDNSSYGVLTYGIKPVYNYYATQYENMTEEMPEEQLINIYVSSTNGGDQSNKGEFRHFSNTPITKESFINCQKRINIPYSPLNQSILDSRYIIFPQGFNFSDIFI